jgi:nucleoside-triphosphatase THEP1
MTVVEDTAALSLRWQRAAMLGSLWAANEIVLGSFLHNLRLPFAGTILATMAVVLLVAGSRLWRDAGILWRAGIVCALMKSISPSAVILGPMVGIMLEAFIVAGITGMFRHTAAGGILGGMLATVAPILQKIVALLLTYGMDAARMFDSLFTFLVDLFGFAGTEPLHLLIWFIALQALPGAAAAIAGTTIARGVLSSGQEPITIAATNGDVPDLLHGSAQQSSIRLLVLHIVALITGLLFLPMLPPLLAPAPALLYLFAVMYRYAGLRPKFMTVRFWLELAAIALLAGLLLGVIAPGEKSTWWSGLQSGVAMTARAIVVIGAFGAISIELRNPQIMAWFFRRGLGTLSSAMRMAFQALPSMVQGLSREGIGLHHPLRTSSRMLAFILLRLEEMNLPQDRAPVFIVTGGQGTGKTTMLAAVADMLRAGQVPLHGFLSRVLMVDGRRSGYDIEFLDGTARMPLCRTDGSITGEQVGPFTFSKDAVQAGIMALKKDRHDGGGVLFVDEIGPLEMRGQGWDPGLSGLARHGSGAVVLVVRPELVGPVQERYGFGATQVWDAEKMNESDRAGIVRALRSMLATPRPEPGQ